MAAASLALTIGLMANTAQAQSVPLPSATTGTPAGIWLLSDTTTSLEDSLNQAVEYYGRPAVLTELESMMPVAQKNSLAMPDHAAQTKVSPAELTDLIDSVSAPDDAIHPSNIADSWPIRGAKGSGSTYWTGMPLDLVGVYCGSSCTLTDELTISSVRTNPGAKSSTASYTLIYSPNSHNFTNIFVRMYALCNFAASDCGHVDTVGTGGKSPFLASNSAMNGSTISHGFQLFGHFTPRAQTITDQAKTGMANCNKTNNVCKYP